MEGFFQFTFMQRALAVTVLVSISCGALSAYIVLRRLSFIGTGIAHAAFGGVALGWYLGIPPLPTAGLFCAGTALGIDVVSRKGRVTEDAAVGVFFAATMAFGLVLVGLSDRYTPDLFGILFGSVLTADAKDLAGAGIVVAVSVLFLWGFHRELSMGTFDEELAEVEGVNTDLFRRLFLLLVASAVVVSIKAVGVILISALLVIPGAAVQPWAGSMSRFVILSSLFAVLTAVVGLVLSYRLDIPPGGAIVLVTAGGFFVSTIADRILHGQ